MRLLCSSSGSHLTLQVSTQTTRYDIRPVYLLTQSSAQDTNSDMFKVSIDPPDAEVSETYVPKDGDPPGPAQAAFNGLIPGRAYNIR